MGSGGSLNRNPRSESRRTEGESSVLLPPDLKERQMERLLSGNEAVARGAYEAGVTMATGYPGTPSTEILEELTHYQEVYCQWSPNEKVALEVAAGASIAGARSIVTMKHVGLNVAADPLMTLSYIGIKGGLVLVVADDPGMHSSQNEQDTRHYARLAKIPLIEPSDSQEAKDFVTLAIEVSERFNTPVILRSTTRVAHSKSIVALGKREENPNPIEFERNPQKYVPVPVYGRKMHLRVEKRLTELSRFANTVACNFILPGENSLGIVTSSIAYQYVREVFPEASVLKLGMSYPFADRLIRRFAQQVKQLLVVEELDGFLEEHIRSLGIEVVGKELVPRIGELTPDRLWEAKERLEGKSKAKTEGNQSEELSLPSRPPVLCPGCPHRGLFYALKRFDVVVTGDIGCYSLAVFPPLERMDTIICMGAGISAALGMEKSGLERKVVGIVGDSTFFHSGVGPLMDIAYNQGKVTVIVLDNRTTAMTGHQDHPGTGRTLKGEQTTALSVEQMAKACGIRRVRTVDPYDLEGLHQVLAEEIEAEEPSVIVSSRPCVLLNKTERRPCFEVDQELCKLCGRCLQLGCPALEVVNIDGKKRVRINPLLCDGCSLCAQVCRFEAIRLVSGRC